MMDVLEFMRLYGLHERKNLTMPGYHSEISGCVTRLVSDSRFGSLIADFSLNESNLSSEIQKQIQYFDSLNKHFEWKIYDTDEPKNIGSVLTGFGFKKAETEAFMVLDLEATEDSFFDPGTIEVTRITDRQGIIDAVAVQEMVWDREFTTFSDQLFDILVADQKSMSLYVVYDQGHPVSSARISFNADSPFAGLWSGATVKEFRGKGYFTALLKTRALEAKNRGVKYLTIDASEMSRKIVEKYGFEFITYTHPYDYRTSSLNE